MGFCPDGPWWPPSPTSTLWKMNVDSVSTFFLEALNMNPRYWSCLGSSYRLGATEMPATPSECQRQRASGHGWLHDFCLEAWIKTSCHWLLFPVTGAQNVFDHEVLVVQTNFQIDFPLYDMFQVHRGQTGEKRTCCFWIPASLCVHKMSWVTQEACRLEL